MRKVRMQDWDKFPRRRKERRCDMKERISLHRKGDIFFFSIFKRGGEGITFDEIKNSTEIADMFALKAVELIKKLVIGVDESWCIITTPRRRHFSGFHFSSYVCAKIAGAVKVKYYDSAIQTTNKDRIKPDFHLLRPIKERKIIVYDDIITTGSTILATSELLKDKEQVIYIIGINNN